MHISLTLCFLHTLLSAGRLLSACVGLCARGPSRHDAPPAASGPAGRSAQKHGAVHGCPHGLGCGVPGAPVSSHMQQHIWCSWRITHYPDLLLARSNCFVLPLMPLPRVSISDKSQCASCNACDEWHIVSRYFQIVCVPETPFFLFSSHFRCLSVFQRTAPCGRSGGSTQ